MSLTMYNEMVVRNHPHLNDLNLLFEILSTQIRGKIKLNLVPRQQKDESHPFRKCVTQHNFHRLN